MQSLLKTLVITGTLAVAVLAQPDAFAPGDALLASFATASVVAGVALAGLLLRNAWH